MDEAFEAGFALVIVNNASTINLSIDLNLVPHAISSMHAGKSVQGDKSLMNLFVWLCW